MRRPDPALLRLILFLGSLITVLVILIVFRGIFMPLLLGLALAYLFDPAVSWFERRGWSRGWGVAAVGFVLVLALAALITVIIPAINKQIDGLQEKLPAYTERLGERVQPLLDRLEAQYAVEVAELQERSSEWLKENASLVARSVGRGIGRIFESLLSVVLLMLNLVFVPVFAFYLLVDFRKLKDGAVSLIPRPYEEIVLARVREVDQAMSSFLRGQLTIAVILAAINATGLMLLGVPLGLLIGLIAGLANMVPYMALLVGLAPALLLSWAEHQSLARLIGVVLVFAGAQLLEGTVLSPRILSKSVNLHPVWVLLAIIAGGTLFGFFGMLLAVPVVAATQVFVRHWLELYRESRVYSGQPRPPEEPPEEEAEVSSGGDEEG